jgi:prophage regulatory protein
MQTKNPSRILRMNELANKVGLSKSMIYALIAEGKFPKGFSLTSGGRARGWLESVIDAYLVDIAKKGA